MLVVAVATASGVGAGALTVESLTYGAETVVATPDGATAIWQSDVRTFEAGLRADAGDPVSESPETGAVNDLPDDAVLILSDTSEATVGGSFDRERAFRWRVLDERVHVLVSDSITNEERVARLLDLNGGRVLRSDMVEAADWSKATVSRVLTRMEEAGEVSRVDIGRGNLVARPGDEPANAGPPFSER
ncbi:MAG: hypothetical protein V5A28_10310 [Haloarculaceae archaeon]